MKNLHRYLPLLGLFLTLHAAGCTDDSKNENPVEPPAPVNPEPQAAVCGNGILETGEKCDNLTGVPQTCAQFDATKQWKAGGAPACSSDCQTITAGTCVENTEPAAQCGNGIAEGTEVCDQNDKVPASCDAFDGTKQWEEGGKPACATDCMSVIAGTCIEKPEPYCGNGIADGNEVCDGGDKVPDTCEEFDSTKKWFKGGFPSCATDCTALTAGSCIENLCGNGQIDEGEEEDCDGEAGVPETCEAYDPAKKWQEGGKPACSSACTITKGSCVPLTASQISFMNWNVQVDYASWGGKPVPPRAEYLFREMNAWKSVPDIFAIVEACPNWHTPEITAQFEALGYQWADAEITDTWYDFGEAFTCGENRQNAFAEGVTDDQAASCFLFTNMLYQKDRFELLETGTLPLFPPTDWDGLPENCNLKIRNGVCSTYDPNNLYNVNKTIIFIAVLKEKATGEIFIAGSTHWNPNNGVISNDGLGGIIGPVADNERVRVYGAEKSAEFIQSYRNKYPKAHVFFGGDFNTIDLSIIFESAAGSILGKTRETLLKTLNGFMSGVYEADRLPEDFIASHETFGIKSGLLDARTTAKTSLSDFQDMNTTSDPQVMQYTSLVNLPVIIDYTFFSPELQLYRYEVQTGNAYANISDHNPVRTYYYYEVAK